MKKLQPGTVIDGFEIHDCLHAGGMAHIYAVSYAAQTAGQATSPGFPMVMKIPRMTSGDGAENIVSFEVEHQIFPTLQGPHVPRFVAAGDLQNVPHVVMERIEGRTLEHWLDQDPLPEFSVIAQLGAAIAKAAHSLHKQNVCHLDLKPANVLIKSASTLGDGSAYHAVLLDFGLSCHAHYPDLLAEELRKAVGSPIWIAPEQVVGVRGDPRSDIFAIGVMLYQLSTGELPFGAPSTTGGLRQRLWMDPTPPKIHRPEVPAWLQEVILRCLEPEAAQRYPSAAHLAFDLTHSDQVKVTARGKKNQKTSFKTHLKRWFKTAGMQYTPSPLPIQQVNDVPIVMVALPCKDVSDTNLYSLRQSAQRSLGLRPGARLAVVTVISSDEVSSTSDAKSETSVHRRYLGFLQNWAMPLDLNNHQASFHVLESNDVATALLKYAEGNNVSIIVMGAATHGLQMQRFIATVPIKVAMYAPCTVILVKQQLPFELLATGELS